MDGTRTEPADGWKVRKIGVIGAGIVGVPMAALLAEAGVRIGMDRPASVVVVQRPSVTSGWKVEALNAGRSPIGGIEPGLDRIIRDAAAEGRLRAASDCAEIADADAVLICVQTDKKGWDRTMVPYPRRSPPWPPSSGPDPGRHRRSSSSNRPSPPRR
jgi:UDP-N-acetyl-D-mannosaminuronate dehydrogenase